MSKTAVGLLLCLIVLAGGFLLFRNAPEPAPFEPNIQWKEPAPVCPWRDPSADIQQWFPGANNYKEETCLLSHFRAELEKAFGQPPEPSDLAPTLFRILGTDGKVFGTVMTRRVKGEHGAIEIAVPFDPEGKIFALKVQRHREPESTGSQLMDLRIQEKLIQDNGSSAAWSVDFKVSAQAVKGALDHLRVLYSACGKQVKASRDRHL